MSDEFNEDLEMLRRAVEEPVPQMLLAEVSSDKHAQKIAHQIIEWREPSRDFAELIFDANQDNAWQLWDKCRAATKEWEDTDPPGLLLLTDATIPHARTSHNDSDLSTSVGFWRAMNLLRERWDVLPTQTIFLVTTQQYFLFSTEADHLKRWIPLKLHLRDSKEARQLIRSTGNDLLSAEEISPDFYFDDNINDKEKASEQWDALREREILAVGRDEKPETLARRHWLPLLAAAITLEKWHDAARYKNALESIKLSLSAKLRLLRLYAFLEYRTGNSEKALDVAQKRWELAQQKGKKGEKISALWTLLYLHNKEKHWDEVEKVINEALQIDPEQVQFLSAYARFLHSVREDYSRAEVFYKRAIKAEPKHLASLNNYAQFLRIIRQDYNHAEEFYKRALDAAPKNAVAFNSYAVFLCQVRRDFAKGAEYFRRAMELAPEDPQYVVNYAALSLIEGKKEGLTALNQAATMSELTDAQKVGIAFHRYIHFPDQSPNPLIHLKQLLDAGMRAETWTFDLNIERAQKDGHPNVALLQALAKVIGQNADLHTLEAFSEWIAA